MFGQIFPLNAPAGANLTFVAELAMGAALVFGAWLARRGRYRAHAWCQSSVVLLNLAVIAMAMEPSFYLRVLPKIPARVGRSFYSVATVHAALGILAESLALYIVVAAGTKLLPERWRLQNYRRTMRLALALWWAVLLLGVATYVRWYVRF